MKENVVFMQIEDNMVTFERENEDTIIYPISLVPVEYKEGDIIQVIIHEEEVIEFIELNVEEMKKRRQDVMKKKSRLRERARRSTNKA